MTVELYQGDCLEYMRGMEAQSVDAIITDLPYGTTACSWDEIIPFEPMWECVKRVLKPRGAFVTTASQPFTSKLIMSNLDWFKYEWVWNKINRITGFLDSKTRPLRVTEDICIFYKESPTYNPQMTKGKPYTAKSSGNKTKNYSMQKDNIVTINNGLYYPKNVLNIKADERGTVGRLHPTQKPVALYDYLIRTYTNADDTVLDFCMGSGTTGVACVQLGRNFIGCELDPDYFAIAEKRIKEAQLQPALFQVDAPKEQAKQGALL